jgi:uncharacterized protein (DUF885 family)
MKYFLSTILVVASILTISCNNDNPSEKAANNADTASTISAKNSNAEKTSAFDDVITNYLNLKNALTEDKGADAATAAREMGAAISKVDESALIPEQKKIYDDVKDDIKEHAEHIETNGSNIKHQREHFDVLSQDIIDLVKATGSNTTLYEQFCPMYNNKKGASWLSQSKDIKNPYYGKEMPDCGELKAEFKAKE